LRKQTLANAERFTTDELIELEKKVLTARTKRLELEREIFAQLRQYILRASADLLVLSRVWSELDVVSSLAWLALEYKYCRPKVFASGQLQIKSSRHPVVEQEVHRRFVPNDISLDEGQCLLLTGPNMAGKSTLMRQVAISAILAQVGSFVPAESASMPIFDRIFTRIGASDYISEGLSTFMVEMTETADMLRKATPKSLLILDEIGRGTSTFDGMSLAQSILEYLASDLKAMTLFATHYHELTVLSEKFPHILNAHMSVVEKEGHIEFLHTLMLGPAQKSYGIQVARLAGVPAKITERAKELLADLETAKTHVPSITTDTSATNADTANQLTTNINSNRANEVQGSFFDILDPEKQAREKKLQQLIKQLHRFSINEATPLDALVQISKWQKEINRLDS
jgi:DNA mismatch repair protein MutS